MKIFLNEECLIYQTIPVGLRLLFDRLSPGQKNKQHYNEHNVFLSHFISAMATQTVIYSLLVTFE